MINLSETASNAMLDALASLMDGGSIVLLSTDGRALAALRLSNPAAKEANSGELEFNKIAQDEDVERGNATSARILGSDGAEVFSCDVGDENSDAVIKLKGTTQLFQGQSVVLKSFRLVMP